MKLLIIQDMALQPYRIYIYNELVRRGYDLTVLSVDNNPRVYDVKANFKHISIGFKRIGAFLKLKDTLPSNLSEFSAILLAPNLRILDFYRFYSGEIVKKVILWGHHKGRTSNNPLSNLFRSVFFKRFTLLFYDYKTREEYINNGFNPDRLFVANNTQYVNLEKIDINKKRSFFLFVGRLQERKRIDLAIRAFAILKREFHDESLRLKIVGGGDDIIYRTIVEEENIIGVDFTGAVYDEEILDSLYSEALAYLSPGPVGLGVLHSFAHAVPVITTSIKGHGPEFNNCLAENSLVTKPDVISIYQAMRKLYIDKNLQKEMSLSAYTYYKNYCTLEIMVDGIVSAVNYTINDKYTTTYVF